MAEPEIRRGADQEPVGRGHGLKDRHEVVFLGATVLVRGALIARLARQDLLVVQRQVFRGVQCPTSTFSAVSNSSRVFPWGRGEPEMASTFMALTSRGG